MQAAERLFFKWELNVLVHVHDLLRRTCGKNDEEEGGRSNKKRNQEGGGRTFVSSIHLCDTYYTHYHYIYIFIMLMCVCDLHIICLLITQLAEKFPYEYIICCVHDIHDGWRHQRHKDVRSFLRFPPGGVHVVYI